MLLISAAARWNLSKVSSKDFGNQRNLFQIFLQ